MMTVATPPRQSAEITAVCLGKGVGVTGGELEWRALEDDGANIR